MQLSLRTSLKTIDIGEAKRYLASVASAADEGAKSSDPRVTLLALRVLARQAPAIERRFLQAA
jgi:hypothetical protein